MATDPKVIETVLERIAGAGEVRARKMFGEYGLYCDGAFIGGVSEGRLHLKPTKAGLAYAPELELIPSYPGAKPSMVVPVERWGDGAWIVALVQITAQNVPVAKPRLKKKPVPKGE